MIISTKKLGSRKPIVSEGTVTLPVKDYNDLLKKVVAYENALTVRYDASTWSGTKEHEIRVEFDLKGFENAILDQMAKLPDDVLALFDGRELRVNTNLGYGVVCSYSEPKSEEE